MSASFSAPQMVNVGNLMGSVVSVTGDGSYVSGGYAVTAQNVGLGTILGAIVVGTNTLGYSGEWITGTSKLAFYNGGTEASGSVTTVTLKVLFVGY